MTRLAGSKLPLTDAAAKFLDDPGAADPSVDAVLVVTAALGVRLLAFFGPAAASEIAEAGAYPGSYQIPRWVALLRIGVVAFPFDDDGLAAVDWHRATWILFECPEQRAAFSAAVHLAASTVRDPPAAVSLWSGQMARVAGRAVLEFAHTLAPRTSPPPRGASCAGVYLRGGSLGVCGATAMQGV